MYGISPMEKADSGDLPYREPADLRHHAARYYEEEADRRESGEQGELRGDPPHFQLMDSADFFAANSLSVMFGNVPGGRGRRKISGDGELPGVERRALPDGAGNPESRSRE